MKNIRYQNPIVNVGNAKDAQTAVVPPFYFNGTISQGNSGVWYPSRDITIFSAWIACSKLGTSTTTLSLQYGDDNFNPEGSEFLTLSLGSTGNKRVDSSSSFGPTASEPLIIGSRNWLRVVCLSTGGHENVTVQINAEYK